MGFNKDLLNNQFLISTQCLETIMLQQSYISCPTYLFIISVKISPRSIIQFIVLFITHGIVFFNYCRGTTVLISLIGGFIPAIRAGQRLFFHPILSVYLFVSRICLVFAGQMSTVKKESCFPVFKLSILTLC